MVAPKPPAETLVAIWRAEDQLWIEFADGHSQGFQALRREPQPRPEREPKEPGPTWKRKAP
jgi:hypothetical protein